MNSNELPIDASELEIADLEPSQKQLLSLHEQIVACEIVPEPFDGIPENISMDDMSKMEVYSDGVEFDESFFLELPKMMFYRLSVLNSNKITDLAVAHFSKIFLLGKF